tara:strand:+ start:983 stop:1879 length:897 start_codon:yes stop_codon:yes gene_type:complete
MRRGKLNKKSILIIVIVAVFTVSSYGFDQLVIRNEDKARNLNIKHENLKNENTKYELISDNLLSFSINADMNLKPILLRRNLLIKAYLTSDIQSGYFDFFVKDKINETKDELEWMLMRNLNKIVNIRADMRSQYGELYVSNKDIIEEINNSKFKNLKDLFIINFDPFKDYRSQFFSKDLEIYTKLIGYNKHWENDSAGLQDYRERALKDFTNKNWYDVYRYKMFLLKEIEEDTYTLDRFNDLVETQIENSEKKVEIVFEEIKVTKITKNYFILLSILSQIFSLLFLLLLFRSFLLKTR